MLAALLGAATLHAVMRVIHDTGRRRIAAGLVARATAERVVSSAIHRLELAGVSALGSGSIEAEASGDAQAVVTELVRRHQAARECDCAPLLPAAGYFRTSGPGDSVAVAMVSDPTSVPGARLREALDRLARARLGTASRSGEAAAGDARAPVRVAFDSALGSMVAVTLTEHDRAGRVVALAGLVAEQREVARFLVDGLQRSSSTLGLPDDESIELRGPDGVALFGAADPARRFRWSITNHSSLGGATVIVALEREHIASPLIAPIATAQIWHLAALLLATLVAIVLGVRSSRREAQLATARSDFVAAVSHELRMPLAQILLASETLTLQRERDERQRLGLASSILREARRLVALVENVLLVSRTGAVELRPHLATVDVQELLGDVLEAVQLSVDDTGQSIETVATPGLAVLGDRMLLRQAIVNLVDNATKYGRAGQCIRLTARAVGGGVQLAVEDDGPGVPPAERKRIFQPWERLTRDQPSERTGAGLGLAVVRQIAVACGGRVWLEDRAGGGARAVLELPAAAAAAASVTTGAA